MRSPKIIQKNLMFNVEVINKNIIGNINIGKDILDNIDKDIFDNKIFCQQIFDALLMKY